MPGRRLPTTVFRSGLTIVTRQYQRLTAQPPEQQRAHETRRDHESDHGEGQSQEPPDIFGFDVEVSYRHPDEGSGEKRGRDETADQPVADETSE